MAVPVNFDGVNKSLTAPEGMEKQVRTLPVFNNGQSSVSCWQLDRDELAEVVASGGKVYLSVLFGQTQPPVYVGSESSVLKVTEKHGGAWRQETKGAETDTEDVE